MSFHLINFLKILFQAKKYAHPDLAETWLWIPVKGLYKKEKLLAHVCVGIASKIATFLDVETLKR